MDRRKFIAHSATIGIGSLTLGRLPLLPPVVEKQLGVVVHSYAGRWQSKLNSAAYPAFSNAIDLMDHCNQIGAAGIQVLVSGWSADFASRVRNEREKLGMYLEGSIAMPVKEVELAGFEQEVIHSKEAGVQILRTVTSSGRRYQAYHSAEAVEEFKRRSMASLRLAEPVLKRHKMKLAIENHKDWLADELVLALQQLKSEWIGVTLDLGNSIALMEDPMQVINTLAPYVFTTHVKDMAVEMYKDGFLLSEVPLGKGLLDLPAIISLCRRHNPSLNFNLEMITRDPLQIPCLTKEYWASFPNTPRSELDRAIQFVKKHPYQSPLPTISQLNGEERLAVEEQNIIECLNYTRDKRLL